MDEFKRMRDIFKESGNILDELIEITESGNESQEAKEKIESLTGRFMIKMIELQSITQ